MKRVVLSFDDGRLDTYTIAFPIMKQNSLTFTVNVATDFVIHPENYNEFLSANSAPMDVGMLCEMQEYGAEIALHGHKHENTVEDIKLNIDNLKKWGLVKGKIGFASPHSQITAENILNIKPLIDNNEILYVRTGIQTRREGIIYTAFQVLQQITHSKKIYFELNKKLFIDKNNIGNLIFGVSITNQNTFEQIKYLLDKMPDESTVVLIFHSILPKEHKGIGKDKWYWEEEKFKKLCDFLNSQKDYKTITTKAIYE